MPSKNPHNVEPAQMRADNKVLPDDATPRSSGKQAIIGKPAVEKPSPGATQDQPTAEEFGERGMGMAAKE